MLRLKWFYTLRLLVKMFILHNMTPHKHGIPQLKNNYAHVIPSPTEGKCVTLCLGDHINSP